MEDPIRVLIALIALAGCATSETGAPPAAPREPLVAPPMAPRDLVMISVDTLRRDHVGALAGRGDLTPNLDALLGESVLLAAHQSCANWTYASVMCALAGRSTVDIGYDPPVNPEKAAAPPPLPVAPGFLPEMLRDAGFDRGLVAANQILCADTGIGVGHRLLDCAGGDAATVVDKSLSMAEALDASGRRFLHVHLMDPHMPYSPPEAYLGGLDALGTTRWDLGTTDGANQALEAWPTLDAAERELVEAHIRVRYEGEVRYLDDQLAVLMDGLAERGLLEDALVVFWADHGEQLFERDHLGHGSSLHVEENASVLAFAADGVAPVRWEEPTTHADLVPTVLSALGVEPPPNLTGFAVGTASAHRPVFALQTHVYDAPRQSVTLDGWRLIYRWDGPRWLYDVRTDPEEHIDLHDRQEAVEQRLWLALLPELERVRTVTDYAPIAVGP